MYMKQTLKNMPANEVKDEKKKSKDDKLVPKQNLTISELKPNQTKSNVTSVIQKVVVNTTASINKT